MLEFMEGPLTILLNGPLLLRDQNLRQGIVMKPSTGNGVSRMSKLIIISPPSETQFPVLGLLTISCLKF